MFDFFKRLFNRDNNQTTPTSDLGGTLPLHEETGMGPPSQMETDPYATAPLEAESGPLTSRAVEVLHRPIGEGPGSPNMAVSHAQSVGMVRDHNEDTLFTVYGSFRGHETMPNYGLFVVADGMGGHNLGERASGVAARATVEFLTRDVLLPVMADPTNMSSLPPLQEVVEQAIEYANRQVAAAVLNGGTTVTMGFVLHNRLIIGHVGDSRAYLVTPGDNGDSLNLRRLTRDHSLVQRLIELGQLTEEEAAEHPQRNVLYRAVGQGDGLEIDVENFMIPSGARLMICSDGLWGLVSAADLLTIIRTSGNSQAACERMVAAANAAGGDDNITVVMVDFA